MTRLSALRRDERGSMAVETALILPVLALLGLGSFQVSDAVARRNELQVAAAEALQVVMAKKPTSNGDLSKIKALLRASTGLGADHVTVDFRYRCGTDSIMSSGSDLDCGTNPEWKFVRVQLTDTYRPMWSKFGVKANISLNVTRTVQIS